MGRESIRIKNIEYGILNIEYGIFLSIRMLLSETCLLKPNELYGMQQQLQSNLFNLAMTCR